MSLINEALKKAQRARVADQAATEAPPAPGGTPIVKRRQARSANTMVLLGAGALVLVIVSVVATVYFLNRSSAPKTEIAAATPAVTSAPAATTTTIPVVTPAPITTADAPAPAPAPAASVPTSTPAATSAPATTAAPSSTSISPAPQPDALPPAATPAASTSTPSAPSSSVASKSPASPPPPTANITPAPSTPVPAPAAAPAQSGPAVPDARIAAFVDAIRVAGIRSSGNDSRVLMNDRVYRVNDIVERNLSIRLIKVDTDNLTFSDANGVTYVKYF